MPHKYYILTARAVADLREARTWSLARWGKALTNRYFEDLHEGVQHIAQNHASFRERHELAGGTALLIFPVREHYVVYEPLAVRLIAVVSVIRQGRDIPAILQKWAAPIRKELLEIRGRIERGDLKVTPQRTAKPRGKK